MCDHGNLTTVLGVCAAVALGISSPLYLGRCIAPKSTNQRLAPRRSVSRILDGSRRFLAVSHNLQNALHLMMLQRRENEAPRPVVLSSAMRDLKGFGIHGNQSLQTQRPSMTDLYSMGSLFGGATWLPAPATIIPPLDYHSQNAMVTVPFLCCVPCRTLPDSGLRPKWWDLSYGVVRQRPCWRSPVYVAGYFAGAYYGCWLVVAVYGHIGIFGAVADSAGALVGVFRRDPRTEVHP